MKILTRGQILLLISLKHHLNFVIQERMNGCLDGEGIQIFKLSLTFQSIIDRKEKKDTGCNISLLESDLDFVWNFY